MNTQKIKIPEKEKLKPVNTLPDRKVRELFALHKDGASINMIANLLNISRTVVGYYLYPERRLKNKQNRALLAKDGRYYDKRRHRIYTARARKRKIDLIKSGAIKIK